MAISIPFKEANKILNRPASMNSDECKSVECFVNGQYCITRWQFSDEEIEELKKNGGKVWLSVIGASMQPSKIMVETPFQE